MPYPPKWLSINMKIIITVYRYADFRNNETAQYTRSRAITVLITLSFFTINFWNTEPNSDQQQVAAKPMKARAAEKPASTGIDL